MVISAAPARPDARVKPPTCFALISAGRHESSTYLHTARPDLYPNKEMADDSFGRLYSSLYNNDESGGRILTNPQARFHFEESKTSKDYVHIRCGYNNKYWVPEKSTEYPDANFRLIGTTSEREEDMTKDLCTLFAVTLEPKDMDDADNNIYNAWFFAAEQGGPIPAYIYANDIENKETGVKGDIHKSFLVRDLSDHVELPRHVVFKGDNGMYLGAVQFKHHAFLQFSVKDMADPSAMYTIFPTDNGTVRIKSNLHDRFLRYSPAWIWPDGLDKPDDKDMWFKVIKVDDYYALKLMANKLYCKRLTADNNTDCLNACINHVTTEAKLWVEEAVISRQIYNVVYHGEKEARVYDAKTVNMASSSAINCTSENNNVKISLTISEVQTSTWDNTVSVKAGVKTSLTAGLPEVAGITASISAEYNRETTDDHKWGGTTVNETKQEIVYEVVVPKMKKVTVSAIASRAKCDVPYSYTQKDVMPSGEILISYHDDGMFTGQNTFNLKYVTTEEDLPDEYVKK